MPDIVMRNFKDAKSIQKLATSAVRKLFEIGITPENKTAQECLISILSRVEEDIEWERWEAASMVKRLNYDCHKLCALLKLNDKASIVIGQDSKDFDEDIRKFREIFEIGTDCVDQVEIRFPRAINDELMDDVKRIFELLHSKLVVFNLIPVEIAPFLPLLKKISIKTSEFSELTASLVVLMIKSVPPSLQISVSCITVDQPVCRLGIEAIAHLYKAYGISVQSITLLLF